MSIFDFIQKPIKSVTPLNVLPQPKESTQSSYTPQPKNLTSIISKPINEIVSKPVSGLPKEITDQIIASGGSVIGPDTGTGIPETKFQSAFDRVFPKTDSLSKQQAEQNINFRVPLTERSVSVPNPFADKSITGGEPRINQAFNIAGNLPADIISAIPRMLITLKQERDTYGKESTTQLGPVEAALYGNKEYKNVNKDIQERLAKGDGIMSSYLGAISQKSLDVLFGAQIAAQGFRGLAKILEPKDAVSQIEAWKTLGSAKDAAELASNYRNLVKQFHPDVSGGSDESIKVINKAKEVLDEKGIPTPATVTKQTAAQYFDALGRETNVKGIFGDANFGVDQTQGKDIGAPRLPGIAPLEDAQAIGLSTKKVGPVGYGDEIPQELKPLAEEAKKYKSVEDFKRAVSYDPITPQQVERTIRDLNTAGIKVSSPDDIVTLYHGTNAKGMKGISESNSLNPFSYLATDKKASEGFAFGNKGGVLEIKVPVSDLGYVQQSMANAGGATIQTPYKLIKGKDGIYHADRSKFIPENIKQEELVNFYNKAVANLPAVGESKQSKLDIAKQTLAKAEKKTAVKPTGVKSLDEIMPSFIDDVNAEYTQALANEVNPVQTKAKEAVDIARNPDEAKTHIDVLRMQNAIAKEELLMNPARQLSKYANKKTGELPEVTGDSKTIFGRKGDDIVTELGFKDSETARAAYEKYVERRNKYLKTTKNISEITKDFRDKKAVIEAVTSRLKKEGVGRKTKVDDIQEFFHLDDKEMAKVMKGSPDYRLITEPKFQDMLKGLEGKAYDAFLQSEARAKLEYTIFDKELLKVDNYRKALKMPEIKNMSRAQLEKFNELLSAFKAGDEFLGVRQIQTLANTDLAGIKTKREALEDLAKKTGVPYTEMFNIKIGKFDRYLYDVALARKSPFHRVMVEETSKAVAASNVRFFDVKEKFNKLMMDARASKSRGVVDRFVPTDDIVFDFLDSDSATKLELQKRMTPEQINVARFVMDEYARVRDYLVSKQQLDAYRTNYITHTQRSFLEALKDAFKREKATGINRFDKEDVAKGVTRGIFDAFKGLFDDYKQQEANFNIMNQKTGEVLPLEKFFKYAMRRSGEITPTKNVAKVFLEYMRAFEKKVALDSIVPKIDVYAHSITPNGMTKRGLELDDSVKRFVKEWLNTKRGRVADTLLVTPGGPVDWALRSLISFTRILDLGLNVPVGIASNVGEQVMTVINIGFKNTALGAARSLTPQGKKIAEKYSGFVGERILDKMRDTSKDIGDKFSEGIFGLFSAASRRANVEHLLGSMTPEEFKAGKISDERLGKLRLEIGKYRVMEQGESILGKTAIGKAFTQYKSWAVGSLHSTLHNLSTLTKMLAKGENVIKTREFQETFRATIITSFIGLLAYSTYTKLKNKKDRTFVENLAYKSMNDSFSLIGALDPSLWGTPSRVQSFIADLTTSISNVAVSLATGQRTKRDKEVVGLKKLESTLTPSLVRTIKSINLKDMSIPDSNISGIKLTPKKTLDTVKIKKNSNLSGIKLVPKKINLKTQ